MKPPASSRRERFLQLSQLPVAVSLGQFRAEFLYWGFYEPRWWRNYLHTHSFFEVCYAYAGEGTFRMLGEDRKVRAGDLFVAKPSEPHEIISSRKRPLGIYYWAHTLVPAAGKRADERAAGVDALMDAFAGSAKCAARAPRSISQTLEMLADETANRWPGFVTSIDALVIKLLLDTARAVTPGDVAAEAVDAAGLDPAEAIVRTAMQYLRDNFSRAIGLRDVAAQVHVSERHLSRLFIAGTGKSVIDQLIEIRMNAARQMLLDRDQPIKNIAAAVGYPDVRYFMTLFRKQTGTTAAKWREGGGTRFLRGKRD